MTDLSSDKKGDIAINSNMAYSLVKRRNCGRMKERSGSGSERGGRVGGGGNNDDYEVPSPFDSHLPSQVSGESSLGRGGGGNNYNSTSPTCTSYSYQYWRRWR